MIVTNVGGLAELVPDGKVGYVVNVDVKDVADAIVRYYTEQPEATFIENLKVEKLKFTWEYLCNQLLKLSDERI